MSESTVRQLEEVVKRPKDMADYLPFPTRLRVPRFVFAVNTDWFFLSHRKHMAESVAMQGFDVVVATPDTGRVSEIEDEGFEHVPLTLDRSGRNPLKELALCGRLYRTYKKLLPVAVHHSTPKMIVCGSLAARFIPKLKVVNLVSGFGATQSKDKPIFSRFMRSVYRLALGHPRSIAIFQNSEDLKYSLDHKLVRPDRAHLVRGSGVDVSRFHHVPEPEGVPIVLFAARMLVDKGVPEVIKAAKALKAKGRKVRFRVAGLPDSGRDDCVTRAQLEDWDREGLIEYLGHRDDMPELIAQSNIVVLPTRYKEGLPKVLLEAAASGRPIVSTDVPGCREIVLHGENGYRFPVDDQRAFESSIERLLDSPDLRIRMGAKGRALVQREFTDEIVVRQTMDLLGTLVGLDASQTLRATMTINPSKEPVVAGNDRIGLR